MSLCADLAGSAEVDRGRGVQCDPAVEVCLSCIGIRLDQ